MNNLLTVVIPSYKSRKRIFNHVKNISKNIKIIIIENSQDKVLKKELEKKNKNVKVYLQNNIGYGRAINYGAKFVKTKFFFVINPDTKIFKETLKNLMVAARKIKNFGALSPKLFRKKEKKVKESMILEKTLNGGAMLFKTKIFKRIKGFDKNIFLYYEDNDYFTKCRINKLKLYTISNAYFYHKKKGSSSATFKNSKERNYALLVNAWHGQWSKFYYIKKYNGYFYSYMKSIPRFFLLVIQLILNSVINSNKTKQIYFKIEGLFCSMIGLKSFKRTKYDQKS